MTLTEAMRAAAATGDWVTPYALLLVIAQWEVAGIDIRGES